jgi:O-6-methylguanine DNA methyltransferase
MIKIDRLLIYLASSEKGAAGVGLALDKGPDCIEYFRKEFPGHTLVKGKEWNQPLIEAVNDALAGKAPSKMIDLDIRHTPFLIKVWKGIRKIPFGETRTYGEVAAMAGCPGGARAIGQAMARNPLPLFFPCHRVVASSGLGGFGGGLELKKYLLSREKRNSLKS